MIFEKVAKILAGHVDCDVESVKEDTTFEKLGIDSLEVAEIVMLLEDEFEIEIEIDANIKQVSDLVAIIAEKTENK